jgi:hypothetical protein
VGDVIYVATPRVYDCCYCGASRRRSAVQGGTVGSRAGRGGNRNTGGLSIAVPLCLQYELDWD